MIIYKGKCKTLSFRTVPALTSPPVSHLKAAVSCFSTASHHSSASRPPQHFLHGTQGNGKLIHHSTSVTAHQVTPQLNHTSTSTTALPVTTAQPLVHHSTSVTAHQVTPQLSHTSTSTTALPVTTAQPLVHHSSSVTVRRETASSSTTVRPSRLTR